MRLGVFWTVILLSVSCSQGNDDFLSLNFSTSEWPQKWELYQMTDNTGKKFRGDRMFWQENYIFQSDSTFVKTRTTGEGTISGSGTFQIKISNNETDMVLAYGEGMEIIGNCGEGKHESLYLGSDKITLLSNWWACDGPGLFYRRIE